MRYDHEYISMSKMLKKSRSLLTEDVQNNPHVLGDKSAELADKTMNSQNDDQKLSLDNNMEAKIISDLGELGETISTGLQSILNGFIEAVQGTITNIDLITVHIGDSAVVITIKSTMTDNQPIIFSINSSNQSIQAKYVNFFELTDKNIALLMRIKRYFNPKLMSQLQGVVLNQN